MSLAKFSFLLIVLIGVSIATFAQNPHVLVSEKDKQAVIDKIKTQKYLKNFSNNSKSDIYEINSLYFVSASLVTLRPERSYQTDN